MNKGAEDSLHTPILEIDHACRKIATIYTRIYEFFRMTTTYQMTSPSFSI